MKKILILTVIMLFAAAVAFAGITGSKHDLQSAGSSTYKGTSDQICVYCHTPHQAQAIAGAPLWNKQAGYGITGALYTSPTFENSGAGTASSSAITPLCMSCHDGQFAPAEHYVGSTLVDSGLTKMTSRLFTGITDDIVQNAQHPVDFIYADGVDTGIYSNKIGPDAGDTYKTLANGTFTCVTCHDTHNSNGQDTMLRGTEDMVGSAFCLDCHNK